MARLHSVSLFAFARQSVSPRYFCGSILADSEVASDPAVAATFHHQCHDFRGKPIRFWAFATLAAQFPAVCLRGGEARLDPVADQITLGLGNAGEKRRQHPAMRRGQVEDHTVHGDDGNLPALVQHQVKSS